MLKSIDHSSLSLLMYLQDSIIRYSNTAIASISTIQNTFIELIDKQDNSGIIIPNTFCSIPFLKKTATMDTTIIAIKSTRLISLSGILQK